MHLVIHMSNNVFLLHFTSRLKMALTENYLIELTLRSKSNNQAFIIKFNYGPNKMAPMILIVCFVCSLYLVHKWCLYSHSLYVLVNALLMLFFFITDYFHSSSDDTLTALSNTLISFGTTPTR